MVMSGQLHRQIAGETVRTLYMIVRTPLPAMRGTTTRLYGVQIRLQSVPASPPCSPRLNPLAPHTCA